jgi:hypothetical protein
MTHDRVHPKYDPLKVTGRTGARGNTKKDKNSPYPSTNIQNPRNILHGSPKLSLHLRSLNETLDSRTMTSTETM